MEKKIYDYAPKIIRRVGCGWYLLSIPNVLFSKPISFKETLHRGKVISLCSNMISYSPSSSCYVFVLIVLMNFQSGCKFSHWNKTVCGKIGYAGLYFSILIALNLKFEYSLEPAQRVSRLSSRSVGSPWLVLKCCLSARY